MDAAGEFFDELPVYCLDTAVSDGGGGGGGRVSPSKINVGKV